MSLLRFPVAAAFFLIGTTVTQAWIFSHPSSFSNGRLTLLQATTTNRAASNDIGGSSLFPPFSAVGNENEIVGIAPNSLQDKVMLITGGTTGMGLESAKQLAAGGATILLTARTRAKGQEAVAKVQDHLVERGIDDNNSNVDYLVLDLDDLQSVYAIPKILLEKGITQIDVLMNNAGVMNVPKRQFTKDGYERTFQSNHLGHFVSTGKLLPFFNKNSTTRIINVASIAHLGATTQDAFFLPPRPGLDIDNLNGEKTYVPSTAYSTSKLCNILFTQELQRRAEAAGILKLKTVSLHPGVVSSDLWRTSVPGGLDLLKQIQQGPLGELYQSVTNVFFKSPSQGAQTQIYLASTSDDNVVEGAYYEEKQPRSLLWFARDESAARQLWEKSEQYGGVIFDWDQYGREAKTSDDYLAAAEATTPTPTTGEAATTGQTAENGKPAVEADI